MYFGIVVTVIAFLLMQQGLAVISASWAGVLTSLLPISSMILSSILLDEKITNLQVCGFLNYSHLFTVKAERDTKLVIYKS